MKTKSNIIVSAILLTLSTFANAQNFQGEAIYEFKLLSIKNKNTELENKINKNTAAEISDTAFEEALAKASLKKFKFIFDVSGSTFEEMQELEKPQLGSASGFSMTISFNTGVLYKNLKTKQSTEESISYDDKKYLVQDSIPSFNWKITSETKKIGNYNCQKATAIIKVTAKERSKYEEKQKNKTSLTAFLNSEPQDKIVTAWFTTEIPVSNGPDEYGGLPGLILEITSGEKLYICSKIVINPKNKIEIKVPTKGKIISKQKYDEQQEAMYKTLANDDGIIIHDIKTK